MLAIWAGNTSQNFCNLYSLFIFSLVFSLLSLIVL